MQAKDMQAGQSKAMGKDEFQDSNNSSTKRRRRQKRRPNWRKIRGPEKVLANRGKLILNSVFCMVR
jgi:hypothetical protein